MNFHSKGTAVGDVDFAVQPADDQVIRAWDPAALAKPKPPAVVEVFNAVGSAHLAADTGAGLAADGLNVTTEADTAVLADPAETLVRYSPGEQAQGIAVMDDFTGAVTMQSDAHVPPGTVIVDVGDDETVTEPAGATATASAPTANPAVPSTTAPPSAIPTIAAATPSDSIDQLTPYDPRPC